MSPARAATAAMANAFRTPSTITTFASAAKPWWVGRYRIADLWNVAVRVGFRYLGARLSPVTSRPMKPLIWPALSVNGMMIRPR
jgi:hypothetical protein